MNFVGTPIWENTQGKRFEVVASILRDTNYSSSSVEQFIKACEQYSVVHVDGEILSHCSSEQKDRLLKTALQVWCWSYGWRSGDGWNDVKILLEDSYYSSSSVEQFVTACEQYHVMHVDGEILSHCSSEQKGRLLKAALKLCRVRGDRWNDVKILIQDSNCSSTFVEQFVTACEQYGVVYDCPLYLSHCSTQQLDRLLTLATTLKQWYVVGKLLEAGVSHDIRVWVIEKTCQSADANNIGYILPSVDERFLSQTSVKACRKTVYNDYEDFQMECTPFIHIGDDFLSQCNTEQLDRLLKAFTKIQRWQLVKKVLKFGGSDEKRLWLIEQACATAADDDFLNDILPHVDDKFLSQFNTKQLDRSLTALTNKRQWQIVDKVLKLCGSHEQLVWVIQQAYKTFDNEQAGATTVSYSDDESLSQCTAANYKNFEYYILPHIGSDFLSHCTTAQLKDTLLSSRFRDMMSERGVSAKSRMWAMCEACKGLTYATVTRIMNIAFGKSNVQCLINYLPSNQLSCEAHNVALRFAPQQGRWDVISRASLSQVCEQVRRHLFREAVYQKRWTIVKKWADHTLYDDQRWWALEETYKHKQWDVMLQLADQGLTEIELMRVRYRLAKHADWDVVLRMIGRGVDVTEVREVLESTVISRKTKTTTDRATQQALVLRWRQLRQLEEKLTRASARCLKLPSTARQWNTVLFHLHRHPGTANVLSRSQPGKNFGGLLLQRAIEERLWHIVMHLVTLGLDTDQLDSLLTDMMRRRQWGVCRVLLEQRVSVQSCLSALSVFMEKNQWMLVARVMELIVDDALKRQVEQLALNRSMGSLVWLCVSSMCRYGMCVGDAVRLKVMQRAMDRREGSVVGECISTMQQYRLSGKEREELFQQAISRGVLQAVKPLLEEKEETELQYRDITMLAAIEQRQWDVVDCCQLQGVDIDMKDESGETPLNREVRKEDMKTVEWKAVEELLVRGANPNVLDKDGWSVLNRAIRAKQWDIVRLLIECLGDIHKEAKRSNVWYQSKRTPLQLLIDERQGEIIHHTLIWCPDQTKGVNDAGETTLHAIALDKRPELLYYQIIRGVNPLTLTKEGHSVLFYAVLNEHCPQRMVGECIRLGFSTHQPLLIRQTTVGMVNSVTNGLFNEWKMTGLYGRSEWYYGITSPFLLAVLRGMPVAAHMLYESGSCSYPELLHLYTVLLGLSNPHTEDGRKLLEGAHLEDWMKITFCERYRQRYDAFMNTLTTFLPYLREMATTPRSLVSTCRLVISHCFTVRRRRERDVQDLCLTDRMKNYLMRVPDRIKDFLLFSDLTDPDYQWFVYGTLPPLPPQRGRKGLNRRRRR